MLVENHVMQVLYKKNFYSMIKSCYARFYMRNMYLRSCYGNFIDTTKNIMLWEIMLWKYHVRRGLAVFALKTDFKKLQLYTHIALKFVAPFLNSLANCILAKKMTFKIIVLHNVEQNMNL